MTRATKPTRKKRTIIEENIPESEILDDGATEFDVTLESVDDAEKLQEVLEQFGETTVLLKIYDKDNAFCYQAQELPLNEEFIQRNFGGGQYHVRIYINGKYKKTIPVKIASRLATPDSPVHNVVDAHSAFLEKMILQMLANQSAHPPATANVPSITDLTTALSNLDSLRGKQESGLEMFMKGAGFFKDIQTGEPEDWKSAVIKALSPAVPAIADFLQNRGGSVPGNPGGTPAQVPPGQPVRTEENNMQIQLEMVKQGIKALKSQFIQGLDPESAINYITVNAANPQFQTVLGYVLNTPFEEFVKLDAEIGTEPFNSLFRTLYDGLRSNFIGDDKLDVDATGERGDSVDAGNDVHTGKNGKS